MADFGEFVVNFSLAERDGHLRPVRVDFATSGGRGAITSARLRQVELDKMVQAARLVLADAVKDLALPTGVDPPPGWYAMYGARGGHVKAEDIVRARRLAEVSSRGRLRRGRTGYSAKRYEQVARLYLELFAAGHKKGILNPLAHRLSELRGEVVPYETVRTWVRKARGLGYLTRGRPGSAGAEPGPNLTP